MISEKNFSGYDLIAEELSKAGHPIGKSSVHRYASGLEKKLAAIKASTEAARMLAEGAPDEADDRSGAVISMLQTQMFDMLVGMQELGETEDPLKRAKLLSALSRNAATFTRASIFQKKHASAVRAKAKATAAEVAKLAKRGGLSPDTVEVIKKRILGIADART